MNRLILGPRGVTSRGAAQLGLVRRPVFRGTDAVGINSAVDATLPGGLSPGQFSVAPTAVPQRHSVSSAALKQAGLVGGSAAVPPNSGVRADPPRSYFLL